MFDAGVVTFQEFMMDEPLPLATIQRALLEFLRDRDDAVVFGAQAVNAYVEQPRMTQDLDVVSPRAEALAQELQGYLNHKFHIASRVRRVAQGRGYRLFQVQKRGNRHLADIRLVDVLPPAQRIAGVLVMAPAELIASKVTAYHRRRGQPKAGTDWRDLALLLLKFPELKKEQGPVLERLEAAGAGAEILRAWHELVAQQIKAEPEDEDY